MRTGASTCRESVVPITRRHFPADESKLFGRNLLLSGSVSGGFFTVIR
jgi:hypothetical protein